MLVRKGWAVAYYTNDYKADEHQARRARRGLWAGEFQRPAQFRKNSKAKSGNMNLPKTIYLVTSPHTIIPPVTCKSDIKHLSRILTLEPLAILISTIEATLCHLTLATCLEVQFLLHFADYGCE